MVNPSAEPPKGPSQIHFHVTGFEPGGASGKFGTTLASEIFASMRTILESYEKAMKGGIGMVNKMKAIVKALDALDDQVSKLGTVPMTPAQIAQWVKNFKAGVAATKGAIEALGDPQWITTLDKSLSQVSALVTQTNFLQLVQNAVKQLAYIEQVAKNLSAGGNKEIPDAATYFQAYQALDSDIGEIKTLGQHLSKLGEAMKNVSLQTLGIDLVELQKGMQKLVNYISTMSSNPGDPEGPDVSFKSLYTQWLEATQKHQPVGKILKQTMYWWEGWRGIQDNSPYWKVISGKASTCMALGSDIYRTPLPADLTVAMINAIETSKGGVSWTQFPDMDSQYKAAISAIQTMDQAAGQFSRSSTTTLNTLTTGMGAVIRNFNKAMMEPIHLVDFVLSNILKKRF